MVCQEDDPMILRATKTFLLQLPHVKKTRQKEEAAELFIKANFCLNWSSFYDRNEAEFDEAIAGTEFQQCATAVDTLSEKWSESDVRHQDTLVTLNTNNNNTVLQISSNHKKMIGFSQQSQRTASLPDTPK